MWNDQVRPFQNKIRILSLRTLWRLQLTFSSHKNLIGVYKCVAGLCSVMEKEICRLNLNSAPSSRSGQGLCLCERRLLPPQQSTGEKKNSLLQTLMTSALASSVIAAFFHILLSYPHPVGLCEVEHTWSAFFPHAAPACSSWPLSEFFLDLVHSYVHGLWWCTVE